MLSGPFRSKLINDPIHHHIEVPGYCVEIMDTPQFQRLRNLKQLGITSHVFPGANHTRFEHSVGVSFLANKQISRLRSQQPELDISDREVRLITIAGLCHDLGHGPFSHAFEGWVHRKDPSFHHETMSKLLFEYLLEDNGIEQYEREDVRMVEDLINGRRPESFSQLDRAFLYDIVANKRNAIDVDKFDYLPRDSYYCGMPQHDFTRLILRSRVLDNQICYHMKEGYSLGVLFHNRYSMFKQVYCHQVGTAIELMYADVLTLADDTLGILERTKDVKDYTFLTDSIVNQIESSHDEGLRDAQSLLRRIRKRDLYKNVGTVGIASDEVEKFSQINHEEMVLQYCRPEAGVKVDDIAVGMGRLDYGMKRDNPLDSVRYFKSWDTEETFSLPSESISTLYPSVYCENYAFCISKSKDKAREIANAWERYRKTTLEREYSAKNESTPHTRRMWSVTNTPVSEMKKNPGTVRPDDAVPLKKPKFGDFE